MLKVFKPGTVVKFSHITAVVTQTCIMPNDHVTYKCAWWVDGVRKEEWVEVFEISESQGTQSIGFR